MSSFSQTQQYMFIHFILTICFGQLTITAWWWSTDRNMLSR